MSKDGEGNFVSVSCHLQLFTLVSTKQVVRQVYLQFEVSELLAACHLANKLRFYQLTLYLEELVFLFKAFV